MLYAGKADLHCRAPGGQNGGSLTCSLFLVPDDGEMRWDSATHELRAIEDVPWVVMTCKIEDYLNCWYGVQGSLGSHLRHTYWGNTEIELARMPFHEIRERMDLSTKIWGEPQRASNWGRLTNEKVPHVIDHLSFGMDLAPDSYAALMVAADQMQEIEYVATAMSIERTHFETPAERESREQHEQDAVEEDMAANFEEGVTQA